MLPTQNVVRLGGLPRVLAPNREREFEIVRKAQLLQQFEILKKTVARTGTRMPAATE